MQLRPPSLPWLIPSPPLKQAVTLIVFSVTTKSTLPGRPECRTAAGRLRDPMEHLSSGIRLRASTPRPAFSRYSCRFPFPNDADRQTAPRQNRQETSFLRASSRRRKTKEGAGRASGAQSAAPEVAEEGRRERTTCCAFAPKLCTFVSGILRATGFPESHLVDASDAGKQFPQNVRRGLT